MHTDDVEPLPGPLPGYQSVGDWGFANELHAIAHQITELATQLQLNKVQDVDIEQIARLELMGEDLKLICGRLGSEHMYRRRTRPNKKRRTTSHAV